MTSPLQIAQVDGQDAAGSQGSSECDKSPVERFLIWQVTQRMTDADDGIGGRHRVIGQRQLSELR